MLLRAVAEAGRLIVESHDFSDGLSAAIRALVELTDFDRAYAFQFEPQAAGYRLLTDWSRPPWPSYRADPNWHRISVADFSVMHGDFLAGRIRKGHIQEMTGANADFNQRARVKSDALVPVFVKGQLWGCMGFDYCHSNHHFSEPELNVLRTAAALIAAAVERERAEQEKIEAIAREREQAAQLRSAELSKVNGLLQRVNERLAHETNYRSVLGLLLAEISALAGNVVAGIFEIGQDVGTMQFVLGFDRGQIVDELAGHPYGNGAKPIPLHLFPAWPSLISAGTQKFVNMSPDDTPPLSKEWHTSRGHRVLVQTGLFANGEPLGMLALCFTSEEPPDPSKLEVFNAIAQQATLALQLSRLAKQAEQATIAHEREQAALLRADELAMVNANLTLRDRLLNLVAEASRELIGAPDLIAGIHSLLRRMGESTRLSRVLFFLQRETADEGFVHYVVTEWCAPGIADHRSLGLEVISSNIVKPFLERMKNQSGFWLDMEDVEEPVRSAIAPLKIVSTGCAPVMVGGEYAGVIAFDDCTTLRSDDFAHVDAFLAVANIIGAALQRESSQKALLAEQHTRATMEAKSLHEREAAIFQERARLAGQIHDTLAQGFTGTLLHLEALRVRAGRGKRVTVKELENVRKIVALGLAEARRSALAIRPLALDGRDLATALQRLTERSTVPGLLNCRWSLCGIPRPFSTIAEEALLNIAHEAVNNAIRHADAAKIEIMLSFGSEGLSLVVRDDGIGFDASESRHRGHTFGLSSMRERAFAAGGALKVVSKHGKGTTVTVKLSNAKKLPS